MRKIEQAMIDAINGNREFRSGFTAVSVSAGDIAVTLHGNTIARRIAGRWRWTLAGWNTPLTRSRINALARGLGWTMGVGTIAGVAQVVRFTPMSAERTPISDTAWIEVE